MAPLGDLCWGTNQVVADHIQGPSQKCTEWETLKPWTLDSTFVVCIYLRENQAIKEGHLTHCYFPNFAMAAISVNPDHGDNPRRRLFLLSRYLTLKITLIWMELHPPGTERQLRLIPLVKISCCRHLLDWVHPSTRTSILILFFTS